MRRFAPLVVAVPAVHASVLLQAFAAPPGAGDAGRTPSPERQDHRRPAVLRDDFGAETPVSTPEQWARRRAGILEGMQQVMGKLPDRAQFPPLDVKLGEPTKADGYTRVPLTYNGGTDDRVPAHLYL